MKKNSAVKKENSDVILFKTKSLRDVTNKVLKDKIVLIGASAANLYDLRATPFSNIFPGVFCKCVLCV